MFSRTLLKGTYGIRNASRFVSTKTKHIVYEEYGDPPKVCNLKEALIDDIVKENEALVKFVAAPINPADINQIQGVYPVKPPLPGVGGNEGCGIIERVGKSVTYLKPGDLVIPSQSGLGTWRTSGIVEASKLYSIDKSVPVHFAATLNVNPPTAYRMLKDFGHLKPGDTVIQNAGNSAVGQYVIQIARIRGLKTVNVVRNRPTIDELKNELKSLGANEVFTEEEFAKESRSLKNVRLALNAVGGRSSLMLAKTLDDDGVMVTYGGMSKQPVQSPTGAFIFKDISLRGFWMSHWYTKKENAKERDAMFKDLCEWINAKEFAPPKVVERSLEQYEEALKMAMESSDAKQLFVM
uniref:Enoyl-[acyl-carrier-protein] reductase, mitochondrial n=1 Tax=Acrobeloides nanus TaxID=290746 RepID=A0A914D007_9BILA